MPAIASSSGDVDRAATVAEALSGIRERIARAAADVGRDPGEVTLVAVSKRQPEDRVEAALAAGHRVFGENRVQEAEARWAQRRRRFPDLRLHLVGPLQTNKAKQAVALFDVIETVDRPKVAAALARAMEEAGRRLPCLVQVNTGLEPQKTGIAPADLADFLRLAREGHGLDVQGLMCLPPIDDPPAPHFALLAELAREHGLDTLSMGMSGDFETAIRQGSTEIRVGSLLFGERESG